jgi:hypothetical protein
MVTEDEAKHSQPSSAEVQNAGSFIFMPPKCPQGKYVITSYQLHFMVDGTADK